MKDCRIARSALVLVTLVALLAAPMTVVLAGTFGPVTATDQTPTAPLANPDPTSFQPRYISGFGSDDSFTVFFEDRDAGGTISYASTTAGPTGFPASVTATDISDTHFCVKDWPINIGGTDYAYRAWASVGNNMNHHFYVSNDLATWTLVSTFTIPNAPGFTDAHGWVYYGFHDVIELNGTYYAFAESNQSQTMIVRSANGDDVWEAFASIGGRPGWGPLELPAGISYGWTPSGSFVDLGHDRGYGKIYVDPRDSDFYLAVNTAAKPSLPPADLEAAFINPANWTWHDGTTGPAANPILSGTGEHDLQECWVVPNSDPDADWVIVYDADFGSGDGGKALGYATMTPPTPPPDTVYVHANADATGCTADGHTWQVDCFDVIQDGVDAVAAGGTVVVGPGTYDAGKETFPIDIDKSVTLQGPQPDVDPRPSAGSARTPGDTSTEAVLDGGNSVSQILYVDADAVVINGLEVKSATGDMIRQSNAHSGTVVKYSIIHDGNGDEGVQLKKCTDCTLEFNYVYDIATPGDALNISEGSVDGTIRFNELHDISSENAAIYVYGSTNTAIQCNLVYNVPENDGIKLGSKDGADASLTGGSIRYNVVHDTAQDGISVYTSDTLVDGNEVYHSGSENGAIYLAYKISNITVVDNNLRDNTLDPGKWGDPGAVMIGTSVNASTVHVNNNNITGNSVNGVTNKATALLDAENNWWGAADGPSGAGSGSGDPVSTNVDFAPWLIAPAVPQGTNPCVGTVTIIKDADPADGTDFPFDGGCGLGAFTLDDADPDDGDGYASAMTFAKPPGTYTVRELVPTGWSLDDITCIYDPPNGSGGIDVDLDNAQVTIDLATGEGIVCTFINTEEEPTAITLASFTAEPGVGSVVLAWKTGTEIDNAGFNLYRATAPDGPYTRINGALIAAQGDTVGGASYSYVDTPGGHGTFYYKLEDVDLDGVATQHGPVSATVMPRFRRPVYRPMWPRF
jgi:hypothetical protein